MTTWTVGAGQQFSTITAAVAAAHAGDTIDVQAGTYTNDFPGLINGLTIEGVGGQVHLVATTSPSNGKAIFDVAGNTTLRNLDFSGTAVPDNNGAGIRYEGGNLLIQNSSFENNQDGLLSAPDPNGTITIDHSEFANNGAGDGRTHNIYVGDIAKLTITNSYIHDAVVGHEVKSRAETTIITDTRIRDNNGNASYAIDLPNGGNAIIERDTIEKGANSQNSTTIAYGEEGSLHAGTSVTIANTGIVNDRSNASVYWDAAGVPIHSSGVYVYGTSQTQIDRAGIVTSDGFNIISWRPDPDTSSPLTSSTADTTAPAVTATATISGLTRATTVGLSGWAIENPGGSGVTTVEILDVFNGFTRDLGAATVGTDGSWSFAAKSLADGVHHFYASASDKAGNTQELSADPFVQVDATAPLLTAGESVSGITAGTGIVLSGTAADAGSGVTGVELFDLTNGAKADIGPATLTGGTWQFTAGHLAAGTHSFSAVATDAAGNTTTAPVGPAISVVASTPLKPAILRIIGNRDGGVTLLGTSQANSTVTITDTAAGVTKTYGTTTADATGAFSLTTANIKISTATVNVFSASATNAAGQSGTGTGLFQLSSAASDVLSGTSGQSDVFASFLRTGQDTITGFETTRAAGAAHDVVNLSGTGYGSYTQVAPHISGATSAVIQLDPTRSITLQGISAASLQASDFRFS